MSNSDRIEELRRRVIKINSVSPTFCIAKWKQSTTTLYNGMTHSCHHPVQHKIDLEQLNHSVTALHNTPVKIAAREQMLDGVQPAECDYCWNIENLGLGHFSDRHYKSANAGLGLWQTFDEVVASGTGPEINPAYLEIAFENICNFKCSYCSPDVSSRWTEEIEHHGPYVLADGHRQHDLVWLRESGRFPIHHSAPNPYIEKFWQWWPSLYESLDTFRITGGEPLLSENTWKIIDWVRAHPRPDFKLIINTNMGVPRRLIERLCEAVRDLDGKIANFSIATSAESTGAAAEYSRWGLKWQTFTDNVQYFFKNTPSTAHISFMTTVNVLSVGTFADFLRFLLDLRARYDLDRRCSRTNFSISYLRWPAHQCLVHLPPAIKQKFALSCAQVAAEGAPDDARLDTFYLEETQQLQRLIDFMNSREPDPSSQKNFVTFFKEYDRRRGCSLSDTFPELHSLIEAGTS